MFNDSSSIVKAQIKESVKDRGNLYYSEPLAPCRLKSDNLIASRQKDAILFPNSAESNISSESAHVDTYVVHGRGEIYAALDSNFDLSVIVKKCGLANASDENKVFFASAELNKLFSSGQIKISYDDAVDASQPVMSLNDIADINKRVCNSLSTSAIDIANRNICEAKTRTYKSTEAIIVKKSSYLGWIKDDRKDIKDRLVFINKPVDCLEYQEFIFGQPIFKKKPSENSIMVTTIDGLAMDIDSKNLCDMCCLVIDKGNLDKEALLKRLSSLPPDSISPLSLYSCFFRNTNTKLIKKIGADILADNSKSFTGKLKIEANKLKETLLAFVPSDEIDTYQYDLGTEVYANKQEPSSTLNKTTVKISDGADGSIEYELDDSIGTEVLKTLISKSAEHELTHATVLLERQHVAADDKDALMKALSNYIRTVTPNIGNAELCNLTRKYFSYISEFKLYVAQRVRSEAGYTSDFYDSENFNLNGSMLEPGQITWTPHLSKAVARFHTMTDGYEFFGVPEVRKYLGFAQSFIGPTYDSNTTPPQKFTPDTASNTKHFSEAFKERIFLDGDNDASEKTIVSLSKAKTIAEKLKESGYTEEERRNYQPDFCPATRVAGYHAYGTDSEKSFIKKDLAIDAEANMQNVLASYRSGGIEGVKRYMAHSGFTEHDGLGILTNTQNGYASSLEATKRSAGKDFSLLPGFREPYGYTNTAPFQEAYYSDNASYENADDEHQFNMHYLEERDKKGTSLNFDAQEYGAENSTRNRDKNSSEENSVKKNCLGIEPYMQPFGDFREGYLHREIESLRFNNTLSRSKEEMALRARRNAQTARSIRRNKNHKYISEFTEESFEK